MPTLRTSADRQPYKYNGKELDRMHGLDTYDYGARQYNPIVGRWDRMDPLGENYYSVSPYAYCENDPVNAVDPDGRSGWKVLLKGVYKVGKTVAKNGISSLGKGATYAAAFNDVVDDAKTALDPNASTWDRTVAVFSLASEVIGPVSYKDVKQGAKVVDEVLSSLSKKEINNARRRAVRNAWKQEKELVETTGKGTRDWTKKEKEELMEKGKVSGYVGHHIKNVKDHPEMAGVSDNVEFVKKNSEHLERHNGNYRNKTEGELIKRK